MARTVTLREVAQRAGVATATASRALDPSMQGLVRQETIDRVVSAASELGYQANSVARALKTDKTFAIGMLVSDLMNPFFPPMVRGIEDTLTSRNYNLLLGNTDDDQRREARQLSSMLGQRVDGLILASAHVSDPIIDGLANSTVPVILALRTTDSSPFSSVTTDDELGVKLAVMHLAELGHRRIAHIAGPQTSSTGLTRRTQFTRWIDELGLGDMCVIEEARTFSIADGAAAFGRVIEQSRDVTAVFAANDLIAIGCYEVAEGLDMRIGRDLSIVGYNDIPFANKLNPPLTTVRLPTYEMGVAAAEELLGAIEDDDHEKNQIQLEPSLVVRKSTGTPT